MPLTSNQKRSIDRAVNAALKEGKEAGSKDFFDRVFHIVQLRMGAFFTQIEQQLTREYIKKEWNIE